MAILIKSMDKQIMIASDDLCRDDIRKMESLKPDGIWAVDCRGCTEAIARMIRMDGLWEVSLYPVPSVLLDLVNPMVFILGARLWAAPVERNDYETFRCSLHSEYGLHPRTWLQFNGGIINEPAMADFQARASAEVVKGADEC